MQFKAIIIEDEDKSAQNLKILVEEFCPNVNIQGITKSISGAVALIESVSPDIVFLDINLKGESGFDLFGKVQKVNFAVIFTTAYSDFALKAFRVAAVDYLLKPINIDYLQQAVEKAKRSIQNNLSIKLEKLLAHLGADDPAAKLTIHTAAGIYFIDVLDIVYCESSSNYTIFHLRNGQKHTASKTLKSFEDVLPENLFVRIHHSHIINLKYIKKYSKSNSSVTMENDKTLDVSKRKHSEFLIKVGIKSV